MDFVLVMVVLVPLILALIQVALVAYARSTAAAAAADGARYAARWGSVPDDGVARTNALLAGVLGPGVQADVTSRRVVESSVEVVQVRVGLTVRSIVPLLPSVRTEVRGRAFAENPEVA